MDTRYNHQDHEHSIYKLWQSHQAFEPVNDSQAETFTIVMPPPNANDPLHVGHAMFVALEDIMIRFARMQGKAALWLPGTDHAGIETQFVFEKKLAKQGKSRFDFDRQTLYQMIWEYVQENSQTAVDQIKQLGASADWSRFKFMLDPAIVSTVLDTFTKLHEHQLVYRDLRLVNYCTHCGTAFSELEVDHQQRTTPLYYIKYGPFTLATVRPETKFGDTALAVHPDDSRYQSYIGQEIEVEGLLGKFKIKVIADTYVDPNFGTGVVKITPAHDPNDFEVWLRHKDEIEGPKQVIDFNGKLNHLTGPYGGLKVETARAKVAGDLQAAGLIEKVDANYTHTVGTCYRCGRVLEPLPLPQFFISVKPLTKPVLKALKNKDLAVIGAGHDKILKHWLEHLKDWNISRQIVWGIRLPVWYEISNKQHAASNKFIEVTFIDKDKQTIRGQVGELLKTYSLADIKTGLQSLRAPIDAQFIISTDNPGDSYIQETDTFDTWFSSAQWPFSTLKATQPSDFERFYPTQVMETGYDILPFWVMRMLMIGQFATNQLPFSTVYMHGLIRDQKGQKMSKSKGNVINPLDVVKVYGADALRMALVIRSSAGLDKNVGEPDFKAMRNLTNKIWNATRFVSLATPTNSPVADSPEFSTQLNNIIKEVTEMLSKHKIGLAAETVYNYFWHWFCDQQIENYKKDLISVKDLRQGLITFLKLLHPFLPFITEAAYQELKQQPSLKEFMSEELLITSAWPK